MVLDEVATNSVAPSFGERTTLWAATLLPAPGRTSTTNG